MSGTAQAVGGREWCVRCGRELPERVDDSTLFCPHCGAPQLVLPEHLRVVTPEMELERTRTTGMVPPPRPRMVDWQAALRYGSLVAAVGAALMTLGLVLPVMEAMGELWMLASGLAAVSLYGRARPRARLDARVGARVGVAAGLLTVTLVSVVLATGGLLDRFALHRGATIDSFVNRGIGMTVSTLNSQPGNQPFNEQAAGILESLEGHAGYMLINFVLDGLFLVGVAAGTGALTGSMSQRRSRMGRAL